MHEAGLMQETLELALEHMARRGATRLHRLRLRVGPLAGVVPEALQFAFEALTPGTPAEGATLEIVNVPIVCFCPACDREFSASGWIFECPCCRQVTDQVRQGQELLLESLEVS